jgi:hypothetical protein
MDGQPALTLTLPWKLHAVHSVSYLRLGTPGAVVYLGYLPRLPACVLLLSFLSSRQQSITVLTPDFDSCEPDKESCLSWSLSSHRAQSPRGWCLPSQDIVPWCLGHLLRSTFPFQAHRLQSLPRDLPIPCKPNICYRRDFRHCFKELLQRSSLLKYPSPLSVLSLSHHDGPSKRRHP